MCWVLEIQWKAESAVTVLYETCRLLKEEMHSLSAKGINVWDVLNVPISSPFFFFLQSSECTMLYALVSVHNVPVPWQSFLSCFYLFKSHLSFKSPLLCQDSTFMEISPSFACHPCSSLLPSLCSPLSQPYCLVTQSCVCYWLKNRKSVTSVSQLPAHNGSHDILPEMTQQESSE